MTTAATGDVVTIHGDRRGLELLRERVNELLAQLGQAACEHEHLRTEDWGGRDLGSQMLGEERQAGHRTVHHVVIHAWTADWRRRHGL